MRYVASARGQRRLAALTLALGFGIATALAGCGARTSLIAETRAAPVGGALLRGHGRQAPHQIYILALDEQTFWPSGQAPERVVVGARVDPGEHCVVFANCPHQLSTEFEGCRPDRIRSPRICFVAEAGRAYLLDRELEARYGQREVHHWFTIRELGSDRYVGGFGRFVQGGPSPSATPELVDAPADWSKRVTDHRRAGAGVKNSS